MVTVTERGNTQNIRSENFQQKSGAHCQPTIPSIIEAEVPGRKMSWRCLQSQSGDVSLPWVVGERVLIVGPLLNSDTFTSFTLGVLNQNPTENRSITKNPLVCPKISGLHPIYSFLFFSDGIGTQNILL